MLPLISMAGAAPPIPQELHLLPEEALPPDGADFWVMSSYMLRR